MFTFGCLGLGDDDVVDDDDDDDGDDDGDNDDNASSLLGVASLSVLEFTTSVLKPIRPPRIFLDHAGYSCAAACNSRPFATFSFMPFTSHSIPFF